jgi:hypothetical protein
MGKRQPGQIIQRISVFDANALRVVAGANLGDGVGRALTLAPDDMYRLAPGAALVEVDLTIDADGRPGLRVAGVDGPVDHQLRFEATLVFLSEEIGATELLLLSECGPRARGRWLLPLGPLTPRTDYALVAIDTAQAPERFAQLACASLARGTRVSLAGGQMVPVENLKRGARILTRDSGPQRLRWIGRMTQRAAGPHAPVRIRAGALANDADLLVSPSQRIFVYQRGDILGAGRSEVMVRAENLVNDTTVIRDGGGFVEYFQLLFEGHEVIYAEGICCESLAPGPVSRGILPDNLHMLVPRGAPREGLSAVEVQPRPTRRSELAEILRRAAKG